LVTEVSINKYIPSENNTHAAIFTYVSQQLAKYEEPKTLVNNQDEATPLSVSQATNYAAPYTEHRYDDALLD